MQRGAKSWVERRDPRVKILIRIRMRGGSHPGEACIRDVSSRGMLIQAATPPVRGNVIELLGPFPPLVGKVVWNSERRFGIELSDRIDVMALIEGRLDRRAGPLDRRAEPRGTDRRTAPAAPSVVTAHLGRWLQFAAVVLIGGSVAFGLSRIAYDTLSQAAQAVGEGLSAGPAE